MKEGPILLLTFAAVIAGGWLLWESATDRRHADQIIEAIEKYRRTHGRLPDAQDHGVMKRLGFELRTGWHPDFQVGEKGEYWITILEGFDGPYWIYHSGTRSWTRGFPMESGPIAINRESHRMNP